MNNEEQQSPPPTPPHKETIQLYNRGWEVMDRKRNWAICTLESKHTHVIHTHTLASFIVDDKI